ncbi:MAG TPA: pyridoxamine 5'-phosphate oxidase family protein [Bacteroidales bacterium]|nr:pyridoxamine 5'-phosphate oxidase family protein [Bacteroidales bacterium]HOE04159.1 pyridoxamine 5'-phosphate oxidase family protein [Bacteroidales bacterium]
MNKLPITRHEEARMVLEKAEVCTLAIPDGNKAYAIPMNFGFTGEYIYFHGAPFGKKVELLQNNPEISAVFYTDAALNIRHENVACSYSMKFRSVIVNGQAEMVTDNDEKIIALNSMMKKFSPKDDFKYNAPALNNVHVFKLKFLNYTAYKRGY